MKTTLEKEKLREQQELLANTVVRFLKARARFDDLIAKSAGQGRLAFDSVNTFVEEDLFELKEACHTLFREPELEEQEGLSSGQLFDILVGSLFHQMMKVKESCYQLERYGPQYAALRRAARGPNPPENAEVFLREGQRILQRARRALGQDLKHAVELFSEAAAALRHVLAEHRDNPVLARSLIDNVELVEAVYGARGLERLLVEIYEGRPALGYLTAARDLYEGGWYERARALCKHVRKLEPKNESATKLLRKINAAAQAHLAGA